MTMGIPKAGHSTLRHAGAGVVIFVTILLAFRVSVAQSASVGRWDNELNFDTIRADTIGQNLFPDVTFLIFDTSRVLSAHLPPGVHPFRVAVDSMGTVYRLFNFDTVEFNGLVDRLAPEAKLGVDLGYVWEVWDYGRFFIDITMIHSVGEYYYLDGLSHFLEINRKLMIGGSEVDVREKLANYEKQFRAVTERCNFVMTMYDRMFGDYLVDYYIWFEDTGRLRHIALRMDMVGKCAIAADSLLAESIGYVEP